MAVPTFQPGQNLAAADINSWFMPLAAFKTSNTSRSSTTTPSNDPDLALTFAANCTYQIDLLILWQCASTSAGGLQWGWPAAFAGSPLLDSVGLRLATYGDVGFGGNVFEGNAGAANSTEGFGIRGTLFTGTSGGTLTFQWAQNSSSTSATTLMARSSFLARRIG